MKILVLVAGVMVLAFSCQKDSFSGIGNDEICLRGTSEEGMVIPAMKNFEANYELFEVAALPGEGSLNGLRPPKGYVGRMYAMSGRASFLGELEPGMSWETHYLPPEANPAKDTIDAWVWGQFVSRTNYESLRYVGRCTWYPDGGRVSVHEFFYGTGTFEDALGKITGAGLAKNEGTYMKFEMKGKVAQPSSAEPDSSSEHF